MQEQFALQKLLKERLAESQKSNPRYSMRAFAKKVGVHFAALSAIMNGKRIVSKKIATRIADRLELDPQQRAELLSQFPEPKSSIRNKTILGEAKKSNYLQFSEEQMALSVEWEYHALLSLLQCTELQSTVSWVAQRLNVPEDRMQQVIDRLMNAKLLFIDENGRYQRPKENYRTCDDVSGTILKYAHKQTLELAQASLMRDPVDVRDFTYVTLAVNPEKLKNAKELIRKFQDELCDQLEEGARTEVYRISMQLFPLSKVSAGECRE